MLLEELVTTYGYPALLIGTFFEGETVLVIAGFLAHRGYLHLPFVMGAAFAGTFFGDQLFFWLGWIKGADFLKRRPRWRTQVEKARGLLDRHHTPIILGFRFLYGLRSVTPFAIGMSGFDPKKFVALNAAGAMVWAVIVGAGGYLIGHALEIIIGDIKHYEVSILTLLAGAGAMMWSMHFYRRRRRKAPLLTPT